MAHDSRLKKEWRTIREEILFENPWWTYKRNYFVLPSGKEGEYHFVHTPGSAMIIPETACGEFVLVEQHRYLNGRDSLEFPCGGVKAGRSYEQTAGSELQEEANLSAGILEFLGSFNPMNGVTDESCHVFHATELETKAGRPDETEDLSIHVLTAAQINTLIEDRTIWDGMSLAAWMLFTIRCRMKS
jgi:8-oxo-dGTP pyrophosphatase MutT (NUDIX family)